jgi:hypothetical protein
MELQAIKTQLSANLGADKAHLNQNMTEYKSTWSGTFGSMFSFIFATKAYTEALESDKKIQGNVEQFNTALADLVTCSREMKLLERTNAVVADLKTRHLKPSEELINKVAMAPDVKARFESAANKFSSVVYSQFSELEADAAKTELKDGKSPASTALKTWTLAANQLISEAVAKDAQQTAPTLDAIHIQPRVTLIQKQVTDALPLAAAQALVAKTDINAQKDAVTLRKTIQGIFPTATAATINANIKTAIQLHKDGTANLVEAAIDAAPKASDVSKEAIDAHRTLLTANRTKFEAKLKTLKTDLKAAQKAESKIRKDLRKKDVKFNTECVKLAGKGKVALAPKFFAKKDGTPKPLEEKYATATPGTTPFHKEVIAKQNSLHQMYVELLEAGKETAIVVAKQAKVQAKLDLIPSEKALEKDSIVKQHLITERKADQTKASGFLAWLRS